MQTSGRRTELQLTGRESPSVPVPPQNLVATPMTSRSSSPIVVSTPMTSRSSSPIVQNLVVHPVAPHSRSSSPTVQSSVTPFQRLGNLSIAVHNLNHATKSTLASSPGPSEKHNRRPSLIQSGVSNPNAESALVPWHKSLEGLLAKLQARSPSLGLQSTGTHGTHTPSNVVHPQSSSLLKPRPSLSEQNTNNKVSTPSTATSLLDNQASSPFGSFRITPAAEAGGLRKSLLTSGNKLVPSLTPPVKPFAAVAAAKQFQRWR